MLTDAKVAATHPLDTLLDAIPSLPRPLLERLAERMIERLDELDGDADWEPCEAGDDGLHYLRLGFHQGWGNWQEEGTEIPRYGADQTQAPLQYRGGFNDCWGA